MADAMPAFSRDGVTIDFSDLPPEGGVGHDPILLGHSFLCTREIWEPQLPVLARSHRVINVDLRGHGLSGHSTAPCSLDDLTLDVVALLDHLHIERAILAGLSIGGMTAMRVAADHPGRVSGLILLSTQARPDSRTTVMKHRAMGAIAKVFGLRPLLPSTTPLFFSAATRRGRPELVARWQERWTAVHVPSILAVLRALRTRPDVTSKVGRIACPTLVIHGEEDLAIPLWRGRALAEAIPGARFLSIPGAGHLVTLEEPERVNTLMSEFLAGGGRSWRST